MMTPQAAAQPSPDASTGVEMLAADRERLSRLMVDHFNAVWCFLRRLGIPRDDIGDAAQDVIVVAATKLESIAPGSERPFLLSTAYRIALRWRRPHARETACDEDVLVDAVDPAPSPEAMVNNTEARQLLDRVLSGMPIDLRTAFVLAEVDELTTPQIATVLELPLGTAASRIRRARQLFDERLGRLHQRMSPGGGS